MLSALLPIVGSVIDKIIPDPGQAAEAKLKLLQLQQEGELKALDAQMQIITAETKSEHWLASAWRPITMLVFVAIIANNYLLYPYLQLIFGTGVLLDLPPDLLDLLKIGLGGYVVGRSVEKGLRTWKQSG